MQSTSGKVMLTVFETHKDWCQNITREVFSSDQWDAVWKAGACNLKQTPQTAVKRHCVVARQSPSSHCCPLG
jgi:hypothetical protein